MNTGVSSVTVSAPGKIHMIGEHVVVYGKPALLTAINKRVSITGRFNNAFSVDQSEHAAYITSIVDMVVDTYKISTYPDIHISVHADLPAGVGLGSSASVSVAAVGMLLKLLRNVWNPQKIHELAFEAEKIAHGNPSGADVTAVAYGGLVWFRKEFDFLKSIWSLPLSQYTLPSFLLVDSGRPEESTKDMVSWVASQNMDVGEDQERLSKCLVLALKEGNMSEIAYIFREAERNLEHLGVVGGYAQTMIRDIESIGGAAKITGAGGRKKGSGMLLCYHPDMDILLRLAKKKKWNYFDVQTGEEGVRLETNPPLVKREKGEV